MAKSGGDGKVSNGLVAVSCAAVMAVYAAGYSRTRDAAQKFDVQAQERRSATRIEPTTSAVQPQAAIIEPSEAAPQRSREPNEPSARPVTASPAAPVEKTERVPQEADTSSATPTSAPAEIAVAVAPAVVTPEPAPVPASAPEPVAPPAPKWKDGTYTGWGTSRHGDIEARVVIKDGRIVESGISQCLTRYSCDVIDVLIPQPVKLQSADVSYVSRATESSDAYYFALVEALGKASPAK